MVDDLNNGINVQQIKKLQDLGGTLISLNPIFNIPLLFNRSLLHRHHEKLTIIDDHALIGSSNIADEYSGSKYGQNMFVDIN